MNLSQLSDKLQSVEKGDTILPRKDLLAKLKVAGEHPCHLKKNEKKLCLDVDCIARRDVFLPVQTGHCSNIKIAISVVARDGHS